MRDFRDAKAMAQTLREALKLRSVVLTHSESLELVAKMLGLHDWNELSAKIQSESGPPATGSIARTLEQPPIEMEAELPVMAARDIVIFPHMIVPLFVGREATIRALESAMAGDRRILVVTQRRSADDNPTRADLYDVGAVATIIDMMKLPDGTIKVVVRALRRATILNLVEAPFLFAKIFSLMESRSKTEEALALARSVVETLKASKKSGPLSSPYEHFSELGEEAPGVFADSLAPHLAGTINQKQEILEAGDVVMRLQKILALMQSGRQAA